MTLGDIQWTWVGNDFSLRSCSEGLTKPLLTVCKLVGLVFKIRKLTRAKELPCQIKDIKQQLEICGIGVWGFLITRGVEAPLTQRSQDARLLWM